MADIGHSGGQAPVSADGPPSRASSWRRGRWWAWFVTWVVTCLLLPFAVMYYLIALAQSHGAAPGQTLFRGVATVSDCSPPGRQFDLVYRCHAVPHLVPDTPAARGRIETSDLIAPRPVTGEVEVVERCDGADRGGVTGCDFYAVDQIRSVSWYWLTALPLPVTVVVSILWIFTRRARRDGSLPRRTRPAPAGPPAA